jgi:hypothetical protein
VTVRWTAPSSDNGAAIDSYDLQVLRGGALVQTIRTPGTSTSQTVTAENANDYAFRVIANNKAGPSAASASSSTVRPFGQPGRIASVTAAPNDRAATLSYVPPSENGKAITRTEFRINAGTTGTLAADKVVRGLANGSSYRFEVRACNDYCGEWSPPSADVVPFGPVGQPGASAGGGATTVSFNWSPPAPNGRAIDRLEISIDGGGWENVGPGNGSRTVGNGYSQGHSIRVRAFDAAGQVGPEASASASSGPPPPPPSISLARGGSAAAGYWYSVTLSNYPPGTQLTLYCQDSVSRDFWTQAVRTDGNGNYTDTTLCYSGDGPDHWVRGSDGRESNHVAW